jgi:hypothetical protein
MTSWYKQVEQDGELVTVEITEAELQADRDAVFEQTMRERRGLLLAETDYLFLSDRPAASQAMIDYRQALRDLPESAGWPTNITWPERPAS